MVKVSDFDRLQLNDSRHKQELLALANVLLGLPQRHLPGVATERQRAHGL